MLVCAEPHVEADVEWGYRTNRCHAVSLLRVGIVLDAREPAMDSRDRQGEAMPDRRGWGAAYGSRVFYAHLDF